MRTFQSILFPIIAVCAAGCGAANANHQSSSVKAVEGPHALALRSTDGTDIRLSYTLSTTTGSSDTITNASNVVITVDNDAWHVGNIGFGQQIRAVLLGYCRPSGGGSEVAHYNQQFDVPYTHLQSGSGWGYEAQLNAYAPEISSFAVRFVGIAGACIYRQELAVVVNGQWLTDPLNGSHNFNMDMMQGG